VKSTWTVMLVLVASALVFKSCDSGDTKDTRSKNQSAAEGDDEETGAAPNETGSDVPDKTYKTVYELRIDLESYSDTDISALRFYLAGKSGDSRTFLKEVATPQGFDFSSPTVSFKSSEILSIEDYVDSDACVTVKAVREGVESDESEPFCFSDW